MPTLVYVNHSINLTRTYTTRTINSRTSLTWTKHYGEHIHLLYRKAFYPYEWVDGIEKVGLWGHPSYRVFALTSLTWERPILWWWRYKRRWREEDQKTIIKENHEQCFKDYDVLICLECRGLPHDISSLRCVVSCRCLWQLQEDLHWILWGGPSNCETAPYLAWDAMLLKTKVKLVLLHDLDMLNMIDKMKRGGLCYAGSKRYVKANSQHVPDYDKHQPPNYIIYPDATNLYGCSMSEYLPYQDLILGWWCDSWLNTRHTWW